MSIVEQRFATRRTFLEGQGHLVEEVPIGQPLKDGQKDVPSPPQQPPAKVVITAADVSLELARQVCEEAGLVVVALSFLNPEQLAELKLAPPTVAAAGAGTNGTETIPPQEKPQKLNVEQMVERVKLCATFAELNNLMADEGRKTVIAAAEQRAEELKAQGVKE